VHRKSWSRPPEYPPKPGKLGKTQEVLSNLLELDFLHFSPLLLEQGTLALEIKGSIRTGATTYATPAFQLLDPVLQLLIFISIIFLSA
jgi:hypothetical protein